MSERKRVGGRFAHSEEMTPAWKEYWDNPLSPHPDAIGPQKPLQAGERAYPKGQGYCHHYRRENEHYHSTMSELEGCEQ